MSDATKLKKQIERLAEMKQEALAKLERARELLRELPDGLGELHEDGRAVVARAVHAPGGWTGERGAAQL